MHLYVLSDECHETFTVFLLLVFSNARNAAELFQGGGLDCRKGVEHLVAEYDIRRKAFFIGTDKTERT